VKLKILMVEDSAADAELIEHELRNGGLVFEARRVDAEEAFTTALKDFKPGLILCDYHMPDFSGASALGIAIVQYPDVPFIFVSGMMGEEYAVDMMKAGATDYVLKDKLFRLVPAVKRALDENSEYQARRAAEEDLAESLTRTEKILDQTVDALASVTEIKDPYTAGHQLGVAQLARAIALEIGLSIDLVDGLQVAGILHDIGKIAVPSEILAKPAKLDEIEFGLIKKHSMAGFQILRGIDFQWPIAQAVLQHHERIDGSGYPGGFSGNQIIPEARILAVADVIEAMSSHRPYRPARGIELALEEIEDGTGRRYDPEVAEATLRLFREKGYSLSE
jgi:putative two-component system response regulator